MCKQNIPLLFARFPKRSDNYENPCCLVNLTQTPGQIYTAAQAVVLMKTNEMCCRGSDA